MRKYGTDKPDLRNPLIIHDISEIFSRDDVKFEIFKKLVESGSMVRAIVTKKIQKTNQEVFLTTYRQMGKRAGASGLAYFTFEHDKEISAKGPVENFLV